MKTTPANQVSYCKKCNSYQQYWNYTTKRATCRECQNTEFSIRPVTDWKVNTVVNALRWMMANDTPINNPKYQQALRLYRKLGF